MYAAIQQPQHSQSFSTITRAEFSRLIQAGKRELIPTFIALKWYCWAGKTICYPSVNRLAQDLGCHPSTVRRALAELQVLGLIRIIHVVGDQKNYYQLLPVTEESPPPLATAPPPEPNQKAQQVPISESEAARPCMPPPMHPRAPKQINLETKKKKQQQRGGGTHAPPLSAHSSRAAVVVLPGNIESGYLLELSSHFSTLSRATLRRLAAQYSEATVEDAARQVLATYAGKEASIRSFGALLTRALAESWRAPARSDAARRSQEHQAQMEAGKANIPPPGTTAVRLQTGEVWPIACNRFSRRLEIHADHVAYLYQDRYTVILPLTAWGIVTWI
jgi:hypothetical protein